MIQTCYNNGQKERLCLIIDKCDTTLCDKVCQWLTTGLWFSLGTPVSSTNKTECSDITEIFTKVAVNTINHNHTKNSYLKTHISHFLGQLEGKNMVRSQ